MINFQTIVVRVAKTGAAKPSGEIPCSITKIHVSGGGDVKPDGTIELYDKQGPFGIQFELTGGLHWAADPIWVKQNNCPTSKYLKKQIWVDDTPENDVLTILNMNIGKPAELHYRLNFDNGEWCDPIMENGGGNVF